MTSCDGSRSSNGSRLSQFGIYRSIDARTEEFLRLSRKRQLRQGCACAALSTAITVTIVVAGLLVYEYTSTLDVKPHRHHEPGRSDWHGLFNTSSAFDPAHYKTTLKLLPIILKALNHNRYLEKFLNEKDAKKFQYPLGTKQTPEHSFQKHLLPSAKMLKNPSVQVKHNFPVIKPPINKQNFDLFRKNKISKHKENVLKYFNKMIDSNAYRVPLPLNEKENPKLQFYDNPAEIVGKRNSTAIRESKAFVFTDNQKSTAKKQIKKDDNLNTFTVMIKNNTARKTLAKPKMPTIPMTEFTYNQQLPKTLTNEFASADCVCTMKLLNLLNKLINNIQDIIPELNLICHEKVRLETNKTKTTVPARLSTKKLAVTRTVSPDIYKSKTVPGATSTTITVPTTIPTTVAVSTTILTTITEPMIVPTTVAIPKTITTTTFLGKYQDEHSKVLHNVETSSEKSTVLEDFLDETVDPEYINRELSVVLDTEYTTTKSSVEQTYSLTTAQTTMPIKSHTDPFYYTSSKKIQELLNEFKEKVDKNIIRTEYDQEMEIPSIIDDNRNIEPKQISGVETLNPRTLEGFNRMKITEDKSETDDGNSFKSILIQNTEPFHDTKTSSTLNSNHAINDNNVHYKTKPVFQKNNSTSTAKLNNFDKVFESFAEVNALISQTQNLSNATIYALYKKKEEDNTTAPDCDEVDEEIEAEQISPSMPRSKQTFDKKQETNDYNINTDTMDVRSMLPISRSSYLEIHRSVLKQDDTDDDADLPNNADRK